MKKTIIFLVYFTLLIFNLNSQIQTTNQPSRAIHVVYDDSGSMIREPDGRGGYVYLDRWGQAKYAMEVFAAMLEEKDTMRIYYMSDFCIRATPRGNVNAPARLTISGSESISRRVSRVHETITSSSYTPFDPVLKAYADLINQEADEKWLVVLTDGVFNQINGVSVNEGLIDPYEHYSRFANESGINIIHFAIGEDIDVITADPRRNIYFYHAQESDEILGLITSVSNRIFNRNVLRFSNESSLEFTFDLPMQELVIFAQGADVRINSIVGSETFRPNERVNVRYSTVAATNRRNDPNVRIPRNLTGIMATFRDIPKGRYTLDVVGADKTEIYYKPNVNVAVRLFQKRNDVLASTSETDVLAEGFYRIEFGIVDEDGNFFESSLLGNVEYNAIIENEGRINTVKSGSTINIRPGELKIDVGANFLGINTAESPTIRREIRAVPFWEKWRHILLPSFVILGLFLIWLPWGMKKRFPKYMRQGILNITVERQFKGTFTEYGSFKKVKKTIYMPFVPEKGTILATSGTNPVPPLKVQALGNENMMLLNTDAYAGNQNFFINGDNIPTPVSKQRTMRCTAEIQSVYNNAAGDRITQTFAFSKSKKKKR